MLFVALVRTAENLPTPAERKLAIWTPNPSYPQLLGSVSDKTVFRDLALAATLLVVLAIKARNSESPHSDRY